MTNGGRILELRSKLASQALYIARLENFLALSLVDRSRRDDVLRIQRAKDITIVEAIRELLDPIGD